MLSHTTSLRYLSISPIAPNSKTDLIVGEAFVKGILDLTLQDRCPVNSDLAEINLETNLY